VAKDWPIVQSAAVAADLLRALAEHDARDE
jgi:hypothetical protein